jgi:hypothetical protein
MFVAQFIPTELPLWMSGAGHPPIRRDGNRTLGRRESFSQQGRYPASYTDAYVSHTEPAYSTHSDIRLPTSYPALGWPLRSRRPPAAASAVATPTRREIWVGGTVGVAHCSGVEGHANARLPRDALLDRDRLRARFERDATQSLRLPRTTCPTAYTGCLRI